MEDASRADRSYAFHVRHPAPAVAASNALTRAWAAVLPGGADHVISAPGVWVLLAALYSAAEGPAEQELGAVVAVPKADAAPLASTLVAVMEHSAGLGAAVDIWTHATVKVRPEFLASIPSMSFGRLPEDRAVLDRWVAEQTGGQLTRFPIEITPAVMLVLASALVAEAPWLAPFAPAQGRWQGGEPGPWLVRTDPDLDGAAIVGSGDDAICRVICQTASDFEVHLVAGTPEATPGQVLGLGVAALDGDAEVRVGSALAGGAHVACLRVSDEPGEAPQVRLALPPFDIAASHDLLERAALFGLEAATDPETGHFPGLSETPLAVDTAVQEAVASFSAVGFRAAAVTAVAMARAAAAPGQLVRTIRVELDRPFGFLVVDRETRLAIFAGWVNTPTGT